MVATTCVITSPLQFHNSLGLQGLTVFGTQCSLLMHVSVQSVHGPVPPSNNKNFLNQPEQLED